MRLRNGDRFPTITASRVGGGEMTIPQDLEGRWAVLLFCRGHWCPYCRQQLLDFLGASINADPPYLQATGFVLRPDGTIAVAVYSSSAIGRLVAADTVNFLKYLQKAP
jgi:AhpC/TSA family